ncbi:TMEM175 family protein [Danxiaibacter flavus]|uniref:TMEM175 family protein n=1 Tax=Danxiaibacter flavus TaxID=3049108 RepID=A0ABV3ZJD2_9BACT|nr:TMEM175 family protein [Chitinophagaceae bacterium DXS]
MEKETSRIEAFSDAVFAIAITLLVLELHVPPIEAASHQPGGLTAALTTLWPSYLAFGLSFFSIYIMWVNHHKLFKQIYKRSSPLMFANGLILFLATCISFPTALLAEYINTSYINTAVALYTALFVCINLSFNLLWWLASKDSSLLRPGLTSQHIRAIKRNYLYGIPIHVLACLLSFFYPVIALLVCACLWTYWAFTSGKLDMVKEESTS